MKYVLKTLSLVFGTNTKALLVTLSVQTQKRAHMFPKQLHSTMSLIIHDLLTYYVMPLILCSVNSFETTLKAEVIQKSRNAEDSASYLRMVIEFQLFH